jgi:hypothetical protein
MGYIAKRRVGEQAAPSNATIEFPLDRLPANVIALNARLHGNLVVTGGTGAGTIPADVMHRYMHEISTHYDSEERMATDAQFWRWYTRFFMPESPTNTIPLSLSAGTKPVDVTVPVIFNLPHASPAERNRFQLPAPSAVNPVLRIKTGALADLFINEDATSLAFTDAKLELIAHCEEGVVQHGYHDLVEVQKYTSTADTATSAHTLELKHVDPTAHELLGVVVVAESGGVGGSGFLVSNTLIETLGFKNDGIDIIEPVSFTSLRNDNKVVYRLSALEDGVVVLDSASDGDTRPGQLWNLGRTKPMLTMKVVPGSGQNRITAYAILVRRGRV